MAIGAPANRVHFRRAAIWLAAVFDCWERRSVRSFLIRFLGPLQRCVVGSIQGAAKTSHSAACRLVKLIEAVLHVSRCMGFKGTQGQFDE